MKAFRRSLSSVLTLVMLLSLYVGGLEMTASAAETLSLKTGDLITFGSYPQTGVKDSATLSALNKKSLSWKSYGYYSGDGSDGSMKASDYMKYADVTYNGNKYRAVKFASYRPAYTSFTRTADNSTQDDNGYITNTVYWFKFNPIIWRVLDVSSGLLMSEMIIDSQPFQNVLYGSSEIVNDHWTDWYYWSDENHTHSQYDWAYSTLREWMNGVFYDTAFSNTTLSDEQSYICPVDLTAASHDPADKDKLFLLTINDIENEAYGFSSEYGTDRIAFGTDYARCQGLSVDNYYSNGASSWLLREGATICDTQGGIFEDLNAETNDGTAFSNLGIRPALYLDLQPAISKGLIKKTDGSELVLNDQPDKITQTVRYLSTDTDTVREREQEFDFSAFEKSSLDFDPDIAAMSLSIAMNAFSTEKEPSDKYLNATMRELGFTGENDSFYYQRKFDDNTSTGDDSAFAIGARQLSDGNYLILVANRGFGYGYDFGGEWSSNFRVKDPSGNNKLSSYHYGFRYAASRVYDALTDYIEKDHNDVLNYKNIKVWITGFSRAGAVSNLLAARLAEDKLIGSSDIFAYTFATPYTVLENTAAGKDYVSKLYHGIHNIIQEIDIVPRVPLSSWRFARYGITYSLPCKTISGQNYEMLLKEMVETFIGNGYGSEYRYISGQERVLDLLLDYVDDVIGSADVFYSSGVQNVIVNSLGTDNVIESFVNNLITDEEAGEKIITILDEFEDYNKLKKKAAIVKALRLFEKYGNPSAQEIINIICNFLGDCVSEAPNDYYDGRDESVHLTKLDIYYNVISLLADIKKTEEPFHSRLLMQHWGEVYLSWIQAAQKNGNSSLIFNRSGYLHTRVKCPVDVYIYDGDNNLVGKIVNDEVDETITDGVYCLSDARGEKEFYLPDSEEYTVKIIAREEGEMTVVNEYYNAERDVVSTECYLDISLSEDREFIQTYDLPGNESTITTDGGAIEPDITAGSADDTARTVTIGEYENGTVTGRTNYTLGETASLAAFPDDGYKFDGWYSESGELLSTEEYYHFTVTVSVTVVPKFTEDKGDQPEITPGDVNGDGDVLANDARLALRASAKLEELTDEQTLAADVNEDGQVLANDARQILRYSSKLQNEFEKG